MNDKQLAALLQGLSVREKTRLCSGADAWTTKPLPQKGIPALRMADGPHGVRYEDHSRKAVAENGGHSRRSTCFPTETALACSFSPALAREVGAAIAEECLHFGIGMLLGPGCNHKRSPLGGRNFEYFSEDPLLSGEMAAGWVQGVQSRGVAACLKHFAVNNQEKNRMSVNAVVDDRALFDLYLKPFEIAVQKAAPASVMASYNRVNGVYATESRALLTDILRLRFGFTGAVVSDWGAVNDRALGIGAGMDLEMPGSGGVNDWRLEQALAGGTLDENALDTACWNILRLVLGYTREGKPAPACDFAAHHALAVEAAVQSTVLLKNQDNLLPFSPGRRLAVLGEMAHRPRYQGGGSSVVNPKQLVSFTQALTEQGIPHCYEPGYTGLATSPALLDKAEQAARQAEQVVVFLGLPDVLECEGYDRSHVSLPEAHLELLDRAAAANPRLCVVLCCGSPVEMPWLPKAAAVLCPTLGGEGAAEAVLRLLYGQANPSGKLAETWPLSLEDTPAYSQFLHGENDALYTESIFSGYRYYDTAHRPVLFPFGYGLSYTRYAYSALSVSSSGRPLAEGESLDITFTLANTGPRAGEEIAQLYLARDSSATFQPARELKGFTRVALAPGESRQVTFTLPWRELAFYSAAHGRPVVETSDYTLYIGPGSRELPLSAAFCAQGIPLQPDEARRKAEEPYRRPLDNQFPADAFAALYGKPLPLTPPPSPGGYTGLTTLGQMQTGRWGRRLFRLAVWVARKVLWFSNDPAAADHAARQVAHDMPFKNVVTNTYGLVPPRAAEELLWLCNGQGSFLRFVRELLRIPPYRKKSYRKDGTHHAD